ncbi:MAG: TonB family protein [Pseudomonadota bacterium]
MIRDPIRSSIRVAVIAVLMSVGLHVTGLVVLFDPGQQQTEAAAPEPADAAAFEDFTEEALQPEEPEEVEEVEPEEVIQPDESSDIQVASENPQDVASPDTGTEAQNIGRIEPTEEVTATAPPAEGTQADTPEGTPEAPPETAQADEAQEVITSTAPDVTDPIEEAISEALEDTPDVEVVEDGELQIAAVTRSPRPPSRPTEETRGTEEGTAEAWEDPGVEAAPATRLTGLDILAQSGSAALYGRSSLETARSAGNATQTNYRGQVFLLLNRSSRLYRNEKGSAIIRIQILPSGQVGRIEVLSKRGSPNIGIAAQANVRNASPFPRPPNGQPVELTLTFQSR